jgi:hypothetical protein
LFSVSLTDVSSVCSPINTSQYLLPVIVCIVVLLGVAVWEAERFGYSDFGNSVMAGAGFRGG